MQQIINSLQARVTKLEREAKELEVCITELEDELEEFEERELDWVIRCEL